MGCSSSKSAEQSKQRDSKSSPKGSKTPPKGKPLSEREVLLKVFKALNGPKWKDLKESNWNTSKELNKWKGVKFDNQGITNLDTWEKFSGGHFPEEICQLTNLTRLCLGRCKLTGPIPREIGALVNLKQLLIHGNRLTGEIPTSLLKCSKLSVAQFTNNDLSGPLPQGMGPAFPLLGHISLQGNTKMFGVMPVEWDGRPNFKLQVNGTKLDWPEGHLSINSPTHPVYMVRAEKLLQLDRIISHEEALQKHPDLLVQLSETVFKFSRWHVAGKPLTDESWGQVWRDNCCFLSHRWLSPDHPDDASNTKLAQIKALLGQPGVAVEERQKKEKDSCPWKGVKWVWLDYLCVPQAPDAQVERMSAIRSLPHYIKCCGTFVSLHGTDGAPTDRQALGVYLGRGWCRLERLAALLPLNDHGTAIFLHDRAAPGRREACDLLEAGPEALDPLNGQFFDAADREAVRPCVERVAQIMRGAGGGAAPQLREVARGLLAGHDSDVNNEKKEN